MKAALAILFVLVSSSVFSQDLKQDVINLNSKTLATYSATNVKCAGGDSSSARGLYTELQLTLKNGTSKTVKIKLQDGDHYCDIYRDTAEEKLTELVSTLDNIIDGETITVRAGDSFACVNEKVTFSPASEGQIRAYKIGYTSAKCP